MQTLTKKQKANRRYYLHHKLKGLFKFATRQKTAFINPGELEQLNARQRKYLIELVNRFDYSIQTEIR